MIVNKVAKYKGQYIDFSYVTPLRGLQSITSFIDAITTTTGTRFFNKFFRYTLDGARYTDWIELTNLNLQAITIPIKSDLIIEFRYIRDGSDLSGDLTIDSLVINGVYSLAYLQILDLTETIFNEIGFTDEYWNRVWVNLLGKLYGRGIVAKYLPRGDDDPQDEDYIVFWKNIAYFYAFTVALVDEKIANISENSKDLSNFLVQRGIHEYSENIDVLNFVANNIYDQVRRRATLSMIHKDGTWDAPVTNPQHGELLKLIDFKVDDEFLFEYIKKGNGWYLDQNSPDYHGLYGHKQLNKWFDDGDEVDLANFTISGSVVNLTAFGFTNMMWMQPNSSVLSKKIIVSDSIGYELTFYLKTTANNVDMNQFTLEILAETLLGTSISLERITNGVNDSIILNAYQMPNVGTGIFYLVRAKIYDKNHPNISSPDSQTNVNAGVNLRFKEQTAKIQIRMSCGAGAGQILVRDIKMVPLFQEKNNCFLDSGDMIRCWLKNNNFKIGDKLSSQSSEQTNKAIDRKIRETLVPFSSTLITTTL